MEEIIKERKRGYITTQKEHILDEDANRNFYKHVKNFSRFERPEQFEVKSLLPGQPDQEAAETLADYFIRISQEFKPLDPGEIPVARPPGSKPLALYEVVARLKMRKPKSMVPGDIYPQLVTDFSDFFAIPLTSVYNEILSTYVWTVCWKKEFVRVIPKKPTPEGLGDLRNISCTFLASKVFESFVLDGLKSKVKLRTNQYGGVKGLSTDSLLVQLWQKTLQNLSCLRTAKRTTSPIFWTCLFVSCSPTKGRSQSAPA